MTRRALAALIRGYQKWISPLTGPRCKYYPTCSEYARRAILVHGPIKGILLGVWRLLRCNPYSNGGVDHVPLPGRWKNPWTHPGSVTAASYGLSETDFLGAPPRVAGPSTTAPSTTATCSH